MASLFRDDSLRSNPTLCFLVCFVNEYHAGLEAHTIVICNAILNSEVMTDEQTDAMVDQLAKHMKKELSAI